jgi:DNA-binding SARP family transcriptional activator
MPEVEARTNLRTVLANLRKLLDPFLEISRETVCFKRGSSYWLDVELFQAALSAAGLSEKSSELSAFSEPYESPKIFLQPLRQALELYQGDFLEGFAVREALAFEEWMLNQRERLRQLAMQGLFNLAREHTLRGEYAAAMDYTGRLLALEPWREEGHRQMMTLLAKSGQRSAALAQYESCRRILSEELGVEPEAETQALYERLKLAVVPRPHNLPPQATPFMGREAELARVAGYLENPDCRLLTLMGLGGVGKTRLALQSAAANLHLFQDGVFFVPLAAVKTLEGLVSGLASALNFSLSGPLEAKTQLLNYLRSR